MTKIAEHTPGPWRIGPSDKGRIPLAEQPPAIQDTEGNYIAILGGGSVHFGNAAANAALIAQAPTLLAQRDMAIKALEEWLNASYMDGAKVREQARAIVEEVRRG